MADRLERLTDLVAVLLHTWEPLSFEQIRDRLAESSVGAYPPGDTGRRQFERDKADLREQGIEIDITQPEGLKGAYRIRPEDYYLPDLDLTAEERVALNLARAAVRIGGTNWAETAGWKLAGPDVAPAPVVEIGGLGPLPDLEAAVSQRTAVRFTHADKPRTVDAWRLLFREGFWYLCGHHHESGEHRFFRVDRIAAGTLEPAGPWSVQPPDDYDAADLLPEPWRLGDEQVVIAHVAVDPRFAQLVGDDLDRPDPVGTADDGWILLPVEVAHRPAFRSWLLGHLDHVRVEHPADLRAEFVAWLDALAEPA